MTSGALSPALRIALWMAFSALFFGMVMGLVRHLGQDLNILVISFWRFVFSMLMFLPWFFRIGWSGARTRQLGTHVIRSLFLIASSIALLSAVLLMPLDEVTAKSPEHHQNIGVPSPEKQVHHPGEEPVSEGGNEVVVVTLGWGQVS